MTRIRREAPADHPTVREVVSAAFGRPQESVLVDALRAGVPEAISLVAEGDGKILGHVLFAPVALDPAAPGARVAGLAPLAVAPRHQRLGIGSALVREGVLRCEAAGYRAVVVLGDPEYYARFGFVPAHTHGLTCEFEAPPEAFRVLAFAPVPSDRTRVVRYHTAFHALE